VRDGPIKVAIVGGGCAGIAAAFELSRPEHRGKYQVTVYQVGWRLGGKGASGRGPADRVEEHGIHIWMGFYENAFRLLRECYAELDRDPRKCRFADWRDAFTPEPTFGVMDRSDGGDWSSWMAFFPPEKGLPGDPLTDSNPFSVSNYLLRSLNLVISLFDAAPRSRSSQASHSRSGGTTGWAFNDEQPPNVLLGRIGRLATRGLVATAGGVVEALNLLQIALATAGGPSEPTVSGLLERVAAAARAQLDALLAKDDEARRLWEVADLVLAIIVGIGRFGLLTDPRGFDAINDYECLEWLRINGASERSLNSAIIHGLYDLPFAYEAGDYRRPSLAAGQAIRGSLRMFFTYRGALFWKLRAGMGDVVFAPFYEVMKRRGVNFQFFHRLTNVGLSDDPASRSTGQRPFVKNLEFDVQAEIQGGREYDPLIDVRGVRCWPAEPDFAQIVDGAQKRGEAWSFESHWDRRRTRIKSLEVIKDFDFVVLAIGLGEVPFVCREILACDQRWRDMVKHCKTVATQAFQIWLKEDIEDLSPFTQTTLSGFVQPFDTWADMRQVVDVESWPDPPHALAYFCSAIPEKQLPADPQDPAYPERCRDLVRQNAIRFLNRDAGKLWPGAVDAYGFRWELLSVPPGIDEKTGEDRFDSQFWTANVNPSDRYCATLPGTLRYRISPLDNTYDNLTVAGDWTDCGFNEGCVEAAVMSGRLAAHAFAGLPKLEEIVGYDHP
jgi:uncharacterized protein with NAD-binding domain and iron-sulfur cluster